MAEALGARQTDGPRTTHHRSHDLSARLRRPHDDTEVDGQMMDALYSAATGMMAQQTSMDVVANNLANATTTGYKRDRLDLVDLAYQPFKLPTGKTGQVGLGAAPGPGGQGARAGQPPEHRPRPRRRDPGRGLHPGDPPRRHAGLHPRRQPPGRRQRPPGPARRRAAAAARHGPRRRQRRDDRRRRPRERHRQRRDHAHRPGDDRLVRQPRRPPGRGRQPVPRHGQLGRRRRRARPAPSSAACSRRACSSRPTWTWARR